MQYILPLFVALRIVICYSVAESLLLISYYILYKHTEV